MKYIYVFMCMISLFSCQTRYTSNDVISKNKQLYNSLYNKNGNIFTLGSLNFESSYMWSYTNNIIIVYNLNKGKIISAKKINYENNIWLQDPVKDDDGIDKCIVTDGVMLMYQVRNNESFIERRFPLDYICMKNSNYESIFFKRLIQDINYYNMGWKELKKNIKN